jgi:hypothetical protein
MADAADHTPVPDDVTPAEEQAAEPIATDGQDDEPEEEPEEDVKSKKVTLADLCAKGAALYSHKNYEEAAECYAEAAEQQAAINGEMAPENSEILFLYGRSLFKVGQSKSDVLGGKAAGQKAAPSSGAPKKSAKRETAGAGASSSAAAGGGNAENEVAAGVAAVAIGKEEEKLEAKKPLFQFQGDENWDESDEEEAEQEAEEAEEEEDDLAVAFEVLDLARVLFGKRLEELDAADGEGKGKDISEGESSLTVKHIKERLADTHDLLAEISLENER